jgi:hypothetical protein
MSLTNDKWRLTKDIWQMTSVKWHLSNDIWQMTSEKWHLRNDIWQMTSGKWHLTNDIWQMISDKWHLTNDIVIAMKIVPLLGRDVSWRNDSWACEEDLWKNKGVSSLSGYCGFLWIKNCFANMQILWERKKFEKLKKSEKLVIVTFLSFFSKIEW